MPLPDFPLEIWLNIFERACQDDGTTGVSLSSASQELRLFSKPHRNQSVQIKGWRQLLLFEEQFSQLPGEDQKLVNLFIRLEGVFEAGYPDAPFWAEEDDPDDSSYVPSDEELDGTMESDAHVGSEVESEGSDEEDSEYALEFGSPSPSERLELEEYLDDQQRPAGIDLHTQTPLPSDIELDTVKDQRQHARAENHAYSALYRVLSACSATLETFTLSWRPFNGYAAHDIFPVLPRLRSLTVWEDHQDLYPWWSYEDSLVFRVSPLFPSLQRLDYNHPFDKTWFKDRPSADLKLVYVSMPCPQVSISDISKHRHTAKRFRICCDCRGVACRTRRWPEGTVLIWMDSLDVKKEWVDQVADCDIAPGFVEGHVPIMVVAWMEKDQSGYSADYKDAVLLTDKKRCLRLWDHVHRLQWHDDTRLQLPLEAYVPLQEAWLPVRWRDTLGPIAKAGSALLLRSVGVSKMRNFDRFRSLACSVSLTPWYGV